MDADQLQTTIKMKQALLLLLILTAFVSCNKKHCWECTVDLGGDVFQENLCGKSKKEIKDLQAKPQETKDKDGVVIFTTSYSNCSKR